METLSLQLANQLEPIAAAFRNLGVPKLVVAWGHPLMMGIVIFVLGSFVAWAGWRARLAPAAEGAAKFRADHRKLAPLMFIFLALGYTGGVLSLVMQQHSLLESPHFWTGSAVLVLLGLNGMLSLSGFWGDRSRTAHAYLGSIAMAVLFIHAALGLKLGLSL